MHQTVQSRVLRKAIGLLLFLFIMIVPVIATAQSDDPGISDKILPPAKSKISWQRLLLQLSSTFFTVVKENQVNLDSSLVYTSHSLGLSRLPVITEGLNDDALISKSSWVDKQGPKQGIALLKKLNGRQHAEQLFLLGAYYAFHPTGFTQHKDSVFYFLNRAIVESNALNELNIRRQSLCLIGKIYAEAGDLPHASHVFDSLIKECQQSGDFITEAKAYTYRGLYTAFLSSTTINRIQYLQTADSLYKTQHNTEGEINVLTDIGYLNVAIFQLEKAYNAFKSTLNLEETIKYPYTHYTTENMTMVTYFQGKFGEPFKYALETIKTATNVRDSIGWIYFYTRLENLYYMDSSTDDQALAWGIKAVNRMLLNKDHSNYLSVVDLVTILIGKHRVKDAQDLLKRLYNKQPPLLPTEKLFYYMSAAYCEMYNTPPKYNIAEKYLFKADSIEKYLEKNNGIHRSAGIAMEFGRLYLQKGDYSKSKKYFESYLADHSGKSSGLAPLMFTIDKLIYIDSARGDLRDEVKQYKRYADLAQDNYEISKTREEEELQVKYSTEEKERQITFLNQKTRLEQVNLSRANLLRNITITGIILSLIIAGLLYKQNRLKQKNNDVITQKNTLLENLVTEKEWLLKEVHHRVKNNLHTVICLLESQAAYLENDALKAIENSQHRIYAMSLIHQKLYQSDDIKVIDMHDYLIEFANYLKESFGFPLNIQVLLNVDQVSLGASQAIPVGLILNEALNNSFKYAFPDNRPGDVSIEMKRVRNDIVLIVKDNGIGMKHKPTQEIGSLGLELMKGLANDLKGNIKFENNHGTKITLTFVMDTIDSEYEHV